MSIQKNLKKGFTLIELMVVIVIIGILAAVAIPKLFGMSAKAKAAELGPAASTWVKMQTAYGVEKDKYGTFKQIGYSAPPSAGAFTYGEEGASGGESFAWIATNNTDLNGCNKGTPWQVTATEPGAGFLPSIGGKVSAKAQCLNDVAKADSEGTYPDADAKAAAEKACDDKDDESSESKCENLTPSFSNIANIAE